MSDWLLGSWHTDDIELVVMEAKGGFSVLHRSSQPIDDRTRRTWTEDHASAGTGS